MTDKNHTYYHATGKRKTAIASVRLYAQGKGDITVNNRDFRNYFHSTYISNLLAPLKISGHQKDFDISVQVMGGGISAQSDAVQHAISKALVEFNPMLRPQLKKEGFLSRDSRIKERKKPGLKRARRAPQWAKR